MIDDAAVAIVRQGVGLDAGTSPAVGVLLEDHLVGALGLVVHRCRHHATLGGRDGQGHPCVDHRPGELSSGSGAPPSVVAMTRPGIVGAAAKLGTPYGPGTLMCTKPLFGGSGPTRPVVPARKPANPSASDGRS